MGQIEVTSNATIAISPTAANIIADFVERENINEGSISFKFYEFNLRVYFNEERFVELSNHDWTPVHEA